MNIGRVCEIAICLAVFAILFAAQSEADIDPDSIVGLWLFDEGKGNEAEDSSGNRYHGELEGDFSWVEGEFGLALEFKGAEYVEIVNSALELHFGGVAPFTIAAWVKNEGGGTIMGKFNGGVVGAYIVSLSGNGSVGFHREVAPWGLSGARTVPFGNFGHIAVTYDGATMNIYVDGELDAEEDRPGQNTDRATPVLIGGRFTGGAPSDFFRGALDEVALFNVALTEEQIQEVMKGLSTEKSVSASGKLASTWGGMKSYR